jgi:hypothetical protein
LWLFLCIDCHAMGRAALLDGLSARQERILEDVEYALKPTPIYNSDIQSKCNMFLRMSTYSINGSASISELRTQWVLKTQ